MDGIIGLLPCTLAILAVTLDAIPSVGPSGHLSSYYGAARFILHAKSMIQEGYDQYKDGFFKVPMMNRWVVVITGPRLLEELRKIPDERLSFDHAMRDLLQVKYTFGLEAQEHPYHVQVIRDHLKRNLSELFPSVFEEIRLSLNDVIPLQEKNGWVKVGAYSAAMKVTCRTSNRIFVGLPICQSAEFEELQSKFALQVMTRASLMNLFPTLLHPLIGRLLTNTPSSLRRCMALLKPIVDERLRNEELLGKNWPGKPRDVISWLIDVSSPEDRNVRSIALRILVLNFASLHTSAQSFAHALFNLAAYPQYQEPLREEVRDVIDKQGWSKESMSQLPKMDSFLKESQRVSSTSLMPVVRKAMEDIIFSDGTKIPTGTHVAVASGPMHFDSRYYPNADEFDPFRFCPTRKEVSTKYSTNLTQLSFGQGKRACPGRFFASTMMTTMMAYLVLNYDMKLENDGVRPPDEWFLMNCSPNRTAEILFRRRPMC
ncbi:cytochrome P450 [Scleroderma citrinum]